MRFRAISKLIALLAPAIVLGGCVLSIDPIVTDAGASFDPRLLGTWEEAAGSDRAVISRSAGNTYAIEYTSDGKVARLEARLGRLAEHQVLDVWAAPGDSDLPQLYGGFLTPGHLLLCLDIGQDEIRVTSLEDDPLLEAMRTSRVRLEHTSLRDRLILHGNTDKLR